MKSGHQRLVKTKVVLTVDTEPSIAGALRENEFHTPLIHEPVAGVVDGKSEALGFLAETLSGHGLVATFFVETVHTRYFPDTVMGGYVDHLLRAGQDVQLHLHPCWLSFAAALSARCLFPSLPRDRSRPTFKYSACYSSI